MPFHKVGKTGHGVFKDIFWRENDKAEHGSAGMGFLIEEGAHLTGADFLLGKQRQTQFKVGLKFGVHSDNHVKRPLWLDNAYARNLREGIKHQVASLPQSFAVFSEIFLLRRVAKGGKISLLKDGIHAEGEDALIIERFPQGITLDAAQNGITHTQTCHIECLGGAIELDPCDFLVLQEWSHICRFFLKIVLTIDFIKEEAERRDVFPPAFQPYLMGKFNNRPDLFIMINRTGRVVWRVYKDKRCGIINPGFN